MPFFVLSSTIDPVLMPRFFAWGIMSLLLSLFFLIRLCIRPDSIDCTILRRIIFSAFLGYFLFSLISLTKAVNVTEGVYEVLKISVSIVYLFLATVILSRNKDYIPTLIKAVLISAVILSLTGYYEYFTRFFFEHGNSHINFDYNIRGTMAQGNLFPAALFLMVPFCLYAAMEFRIHWKIISAISVVSILTLVLFSRLAMLVSTTVTIFALLLLYIFGKSSISKETKAYISKWFLYILIVSVVAGTIFGCLYVRTNSITSLMDRLDYVFHPTYKKNETRIMMWRQTLELAQDNPICGVGAGNWKISFPSYGIEDLGQSMFKTEYYVRPENDYVWTLSEIGILGFGFYLSIFGIIFWYIFKILNSHTDANNKLLSILMFFGFVGYMVFSCFTFPRERIFHSMFLLLMMAVVISIYHRSFGKQGDISRLLMFVLAIPCLCLLLSAIYIGHARLTAEIHTKRAFAARKAKVWPAVISEIDKGYSVFATLDPMSTPLKWYRGEANFLLNNIPEALEDFKEAYKAHPYHIHVLNNLATCYEMTGNHNLAINYYNKALEIYPEFEDALINLGATYYNSGRYEEAYETLLRCNPNTQNPKLEKYLKSVKKMLDKKGGVTIGY